MSSWLAGYIHSRESHIKNHLSKDQPLPLSGSMQIDSELEEKIEQLSILYERYGEKEEKKACIQKSVEAISQEVDDFSFGCSSDCFKKLNDCFAHFNRRMIAAGLKAGDIEEGKSIFKELYLEQFEKKWSQGAGEEFYRILRLSCIQEKATAAQKWTNQFFKGSAFFNRYQESVEEIENLVVRSLEDCCSQALQNQSKLINSQQNLLAVKPVTVSTQVIDRDLDVKTAKKLLISCIVAGSNILKEKQPIMNNEAGQVFLTCIQGFY